MLKVVHVIVPARAQLEPAREASPLGLVKVAAASHLLSTEMIYHYYIFYIINYINLH